MARESLADREVVYRKLIEAAPDAIVTANQEGSIVLVNAQAEKLFGYKRAELLSQSLEMLVPERLRGKHRFHRADYMSGPVSRPMETGLELHGLRKGGNITVYSEVGHGTTFKVYLPLSEEAPAKPETAQVESIIPSGTETILLVEDEDSLREVTREYLTNKGFTVLVARDPDSAIAAAERSDKPIDLLLTDVILPGCSGVQLAQRLTANQPRMRVLHVSGYTADAICASRRSRLELRLSLEAIFVARSCPRSSFHPGCRPAEARRGGVLIAGKPKIKAATAVRQWPLQKNVV